MSDPVVKERHRAAVLLAMQDPAVKERTREAARKRWANPETREKQVAKRRSAEFKDRIGPKVRATFKAQLAAMTQEELEAFKRDRAALAAREFLVIPPDGESFVIKNLKAFCAQRGINEGCAHAVMRGKLRRTKGYAFQRINRAKS
jgi:hypothetical protein